MTRTLALAVTLVSLPVLAGAQAQGPVAPAAAWKKLLSTVVAEGALVPATADVAAMYSLEKEFTDPGGRVMMFNVVALSTAPPGATVTTGRVMFIYAEIQALPDGSVSNQGWHMELSPAGRVEKIIRTKSIRRAGNTVRDPAIILALDDPEVAKLLANMLGFWMMFTPAR